MFVVVFPEQDVQNFLFISRVMPHTRLNNMNIIFLLILFYYLNHLRFKFDLYEKNS